MFKKHMMITKTYLDSLTYEIIGSAIEVHKIMGSGLLESVYHQCMREELKIRGIDFLTEMRIPIIYKEKYLDIDFRCDLLVNQSIVVELIESRTGATAYTRSSVAHLYEIAEMSERNFNKFQLFKYF
ncbi:hypothetical protein CAPN006_15720 [Capnocytophaga canimorsus]|nr:hypothetical protein CAPN006_15720 [Capnocytophaga canimorsus]